MIIINIEIFCQELSPILQIIGWVLNLFKISLPIILIAIGIFDIGKVVISNKSSEIKKHLLNLLKRIAIAILVFFIPSLIMVVFGFVQGFEDMIYESGVDYKVCYDCMFNPTSEICKNAASKA